MLKRPRQCYSSLCHCPSIILRLSLHLHCLAHPSSSELSGRNASDNIIIIILISYDYDTVSVSSTEPQHTVQMLGAPSSARLCLMYLKPRQATQNWPIIGAGMLKIQECVR